MENLQSINLDLAGEFLEIAAMLILIKSRSLLPKKELTDEELEEEDPEEILRRRLLEYQYYKNAAFELGSLDILGRDVFQRPENVELVSDSKEENPLLLKQGKQFCDVVSKQRDNWREVFPYEY